MSFDDFIQLRDKGNMPDNLEPLLKALLIEADGNWDESHRIAQNVHTKDGSWVHAYLHRKEGDLSNASYWYRNARKEMPLISLTEEWELIAKCLCE